MVDIISDDFENTEKIKAVIFDLDDTLISEYEFVASGYRFVSRLLSERLRHTPEEIEERLWELSEETYSRAFNRLFDSYEETYTEEELRELIRAYREHPADTRFYPDVPETLMALKEKGILMGIISDGDPDRQRNKIRTAVANMMALKEAGLHNAKEAGLHNKLDMSLHKSAGQDSETSASDKDTGYWFDEIILNDEFGGAEYRKPNPKGFAEMAERLKVKPSEMIYIGDNPAKDFHIAAELPVRTARIIREKGIYADREYLDGIKETWRIQKLTDVTEIISMADDRVRLT